MNSSERLSIIRRGKFYFASTVPKEIIFPTEWCTRGPLEAAGFSFPWDPDDLDPSCLSSDGKPPKRFKFKSDAIAPPEMPIYIYTFEGYVEIKKVNGEFVEWICRPIFSHYLKEFVVLKSWKEIRPGNKKYVGLINES